MYDTYVLVSFLLGQQSNAIRAFHLLKLLTATPEYEILLILSINYSRTVA